MRYNEINSAIESEAGHIEPSIYKLEKKTSWVVAEGPPPRSGPAIIKVGP